MIFSVRPPVQNLTKMNENMRKRNEILTWSQTAQNDPGSSKITSELTSDENSTFRHFCQGLEKSWKNENQNLQECKKLTFRNEKNLENWNIEKSRFEIDPKIQVTLKNCIPQEYFDLDFDIDVSGK